MGSGVSDFECNILRLDNLACSVPRFYRCAHMHCSHKNDNLKVTKLGPVHIRREGLLPRKSGDHHSLIYIAVGACATRH